MKNVITKKVFKMMGGYEEDQEIARELIARGKLSERDYKILYLMYIAEYWAEPEMTNRSEFIKKLCNIDNKSSRINRKFLRAYKKVRNEIENE